MGSNKLFYTYNGKAIDSVNISIAYEGSLIFNGTNKAIYAKGSEYGSYLQSEPVDNNIKSYVISQPTVGEPTVGRYNENVYEQYGYMYAYSANVHPGANALVSGQKVYEYINNNAVSFEDMPSGIYKMIISDYKISGGNYASTEAGVSNMPLHFDTKPELIYEGTTYNYVIPIKKEKGYILYLPGDETPNTIANQKGHYVAAKWNDDHSIITITLTDVVSEATEFKFDHRKSSTTDYGYLLSLVQPLEGSTITQVSLSGKYVVVRNTNTMYMFKFEYVKLSKNTSSFFGDIVNNVLDADIINDLVEFPDDKYLNQSSISGAFDTIGTVSSDKSTLSFNPMPIDFWGEEEDLSFKGQPGYYRFKAVGHSVRDGVNYYLGVGSTSENLIYTTNEDNSSVFYFDGSSLQSKSTNLYVNGLGLSSTKGIINIDAAPESIGTNQFRIHNGTAYIVDWANGGHVQNCMDGNNNWIGWEITKVI